MGFFFFFFFGDAILSVASIFLPTPTEYYWDIGGVVVVVVVSGWVVCRRRHHRIPSSTHIVLLVHTKKVVHRSKKNRQSDEKRQRKVFFDSSSRPTQREGDEAVDPPNRTEEGRGREGGVERWLLSRDTGLNTGTNDDEELATERQPTEECHSRPIVVVGSWWVCRFFGCFASWSQSLSLVGGFTKRYLAGGRPFRDFSGFLQSRRTVNCATSPECSNR